MDKVDDRFSGEEMHPNTSTNTDERHSNKNLSSKQRKSFRWGKKRPDTPMLSEKIKLLWRQFSSTDSASTNSSCPNSANICGSESLDQDSLFQNLETKQKLTLRPLKGKGHSKGPDISKAEMTKNSSSSEVGKKQ